MTASGSSSITTHRECRATDISRAHESDRRAARDSLGVVGTPQPPPQFEREIGTVKLTDQLYLLDGAGGNVAVLVWDDGVLLVDDKIAPVTAGLKAAVAAITPKPIRFVVNTHWHPNHRGGNAALAADDAVVVAHENVRKHMSVDTFVEVFARNLPASPPQVTFTRDVTLHLGGEEISIVHVDAAHTDGDSFVRFRTANALHMRDCFLNGSYPVIDYSTGGTYAGTIAAAADTALGMVDSGTRVIPGHGPWRTSVSCARGATCRQRSSRT